MRKGLNMNLKRMKQSTQALACYKKAVVMANVNVDVDLPLPKLVDPPCDVAGIIFPKVNCELSYFVNLGVYGFKYGYIFGEHANGDAVYAATCTHAFVFSGGSHIICLGV